MSSSTPSSMPSLFDSPDQAAAFDAVMTPLAKLFGVKVDKNIPPSAFINKHGANVIRHVDQHGPTSQTKPEIFKIPYGTGFLYGHVYATFVPNINNDHWDAVAYFGDDKDEKEFVGLGSDPSQATAVQKAQEALTNKLKIEEANNRVIRLVVVSAHGKTGDQKTDDGRLVLEAEMSAKLRQARLSGIGSHASSRFVVIYKGAFEASELGTELQAENPHTIVFYGHMGPNMFELRKPNGEIIPVSGTNLAKYFNPKIWPGMANVELVVFTGCKSAAMAKALTDVIPYAIGTNAEISNEVAHTFTSTLYFHLAAGATVKVAYDRADMQTETLCGVTNLFVLHKKDKEHVNIFGNEKRDGSTVLVKHR